MTADLLATPEPAPSGSTGRRRALALALAVAAGCGVGWQLRAGEVASAQRDAAAARAAADTAREQAAAQEVDVTRGRAAYDGAAAETSRARKEIAAASLSDLGPGILQPGQIMVCGDGRATSCLVAEHSRHREPAGPVRLRLLVAPDPSGLLVGGAQEHPWIAVDPAGQCPSLADPAGYVGDTWCASASLYQRLRPSSGGA